MIKVCLCVYAAYSLNLKDKWRVKLKREKSERKKARKESEKGKAGKIKTKKSQILKLRWKLTAESKGKRSAERFLHVYHCHNQELFMWFDFKNRSWIRSEKGPRSGDTQETWLKTTFHEVTFHGFELCKLKITDICALTKRGIKSRRKKTKESFRCCWVVRWEVYCTFHTQIQEFVAFLSRIWQVRVHGEIRVLFPVFSWLFMHYDITEHKLHLYRLIVSVIYYCTKFSYQTGNNKVTYLLLHLTV